LNYVAAHKVILAFGINPEWLATGNGRMWLPVPIPSPKELNVGVRASFSRIYEKHLAKAVAETTKEWESRPPPEPIPLRINAADPRARLMAEAKMVNWIKRLILCLPDSRLEAFLNFLYLEGTKRARSYPADSKEAFEKRVETMDCARAQMGFHKKFLADEQPGNDKLPASSQKKDLTEAETCLKHVDVKAQLPNLRERLKKVTQESGQKSALAKFLGVPLASVSRWLSGEREPGGEIALRLLHWVETAERKK
jgi:DNA-binding transcriptional regulator YiaG